MAEQVAGWWIIQGDKKHGPYTKGNLADMVKSGQLTGTDLLWKEGLKDPVSAVDMIGLLLALPDQSPYPEPQTSPSGVKPGDRLPNGNLPSSPSTRAKDSLFSFRGRIGRLRYAAIYVLCALLYAISVEPKNSIFCLIAAVPITWVFVAAMAKRLHDLNCTAWILLVGLFVPPFAAVSVVLIFLPGNDGPNRFNL